MTDEKPTIFGVPVDFVVDCRPPTTTPSPVVYWKHDTTSSMSTFDPMAYFTYVYEEPPPGPGIEDDPVSLYDDPGKEGELP
jgi:hypothetical protein